MNPVKTLVLALILLIAIIAFFNFRSDKVVIENEPIENITEESLAPFDLLKNQTIKVPDSDVLVTLQDGEAPFEVSPDSPTQGYIILLNDKFSQWGESGRTDLSVVFAVDSGGTGVFFYLVLFDVSGEVFTQKSEVFLGDRIDITHVGIGELVHDPEADYRVTVQTLVRNEGEPLSTPPSVQETRTFYVTDQLLEEIEVGRDDS